MKIYLDHSATTPVDKKVLEAMLPYFSDKFGNPSSIHNFGQAAIRAVDKARSELAKFLNCEDSEVVFTSGATESNNLAIRGLLGALGDADVKRPHVITSAIEHPAILEPCRELEERGVEITFLPVKPNGVIDINQLKKSIKKNTVLVSIMYVNSEVGSLQPIREVGKIIKKINSERLKKWQQTRPLKRGSRPQRIYFHTDATQAVNFFSCNTKYLHVDLLSLSAHKIYGPKGVGALFLKRGVPIKAVQLGGHHESNRRSGTLNVAGIVGLGEAVKFLKPRKVNSNNKKITKLRDMLVEGIIENISDVVLNTDRDNATPAHAHFSFLGAEGESVLIALDLAGIAVSTGSACTSGSSEISHVLSAMGIKEEAAHSSIRFSLGKNNTEAEIKRVIKVLLPIIERLRKIAPKF